jgi:hypothetical protein
MVKGQYVTESVKLTVRCLWFWICSVMSIVVGQYVGESDKLLVDVYGYE